MTGMNWLARMTGMTGMTRVTEIEWIKYGTIIFLIMQM